MLLYKQRFISERYQELLDEELNRQRKEQKAREDAVKEMQKADWNKDYPHKLGKRNV